jgi:hypothetical protein
MEVEALAQLLHETSERHGELEAVAERHDWWDWYAAYMNARMHGSTPDDASTTANQFIEQVRHVHAG